jgi:hypothetical protein
MQFLLSGFCAQVAAAIGRFRAAASSTVLETNRGGQMSDEGRGLAGAAPGAASLPGQEPEHLTATPHSQSPADQKLDDLQGSIDALIEDWRTDEYAWWIGSDEGKHALPLLYQIGGLIGQFRQRLGRQPLDAYNPRLPEGAIEATPAQIAQAHHEAREEAERARVLHERAERAAGRVEPEALDTHGHTPPGTPHPDDAPAPPDEQEPLARDRAEVEATSAPEPEPEPEPPAEIDVVEGPPGGEPDESR